MAQSTIEWTEATWNPTTGCHKISAGCRDCYAEIMTRRLKAMGQPKYAAGFNVVKTHEVELATPLGWKKPKTIFVNSMSDLFHKDVPLSFIIQVFAVMKQCPQHTFQVLTKRAERMCDFSPVLDWPPNVWMGVSVEDNRVTDRIDYLRNSDAKTKFLSLEPLIGPLPNLNLTRIDWVIVGGESGRRQPRPMREAWVQDIRQQCEVAGVSFFFKQWGGTDKKASGRLLNGRTYDEMPVQQSTSWIGAK